MVDVVQQSEKAALCPEDAIPLTRIEAAVDVVGAVSTIKLSHVYTNKTQQPLLIKFAFPLDYEAAVGSLTIETATRTLTARLQDKEKAEAKFADAIQKGDRGYLLRYDEAQSDIL